MENTEHGCITIGGEIVHHIYNEREFYRALGYTDGILNLGVLPEEFVWDEYRKDNSNQSRLCLQAKIIEFLLNNSLKFAVHFPERFGKCIGNCPDVPRQQRLNCTYCLMHPSQIADIPYK